MRGLGTCILVVALASVPAGDCIAEGEERFLRSRGGAGGHRVTAFHGCMADGVSCGRE